MTAQGAAHSAVVKARAKGDLTPLPCEQCVEPDPGIATLAHHDDYSRPLSVRWLCRPHHHAWHREHGHAEGWEYPAATPRLVRTAPPPQSRRFSGQALAHVRLRASFAQAEFARLLGIGCRTLQRYEAGDDVPSANLIGKVAVITGCKLDDLFDTPPV